MLRPTAGLVPVTSGTGLVEMAGPARVRVLLNAPNVQALRYRREIVEIRILNYGEAYRVPAKWGNAQKLSTNFEAPDNPPRVWKLKRLPD